MSKFPSPPSLPSDYDTKPVINHYIDEQNEFPQQLPSYNMDIPSHQLHCFPIQYEYPPIYPSTEGHLYDGIPTEKDEIASMYLPKCPPYPPSIDNGTGTPDSESPSP
ncbi:high mobility group (HMG)-box containing transcription factor Sox [Oopsacas minuta]|uniref:High mobility group (HMG)-box containing transcription factor Sox n=1 Tax=Oopsacas minuta TaxID=111878 RepID=A0AAV7JJ24_9METZ|nr:high mobility group (HMG)-box containing transcription factor Sox [Oopsacas minuta]